MVLCDCIDTVSFHDGIYDGFIQDAFSAFMIVFFCILAFVSDNTVVRWSFSLRLNNISLILQYTPSSLAPFVDILVVKLIELLCALEVQLECI